MLDLVSGKYKKPAIESEKEIEAISRPVLEKTLIPPSLWKKVLGCVEMKDCLKGGLLDKEKFLVALREQIAYWEKFLYQPYLYEPPRGKEEDINLGRELAKKICPEIRSQRIKADLEEKRRGRRWKI